MSSQAQAARIGQKLRLGVSMVVACLITAVMSWAGVSPASAAPTSPVVLVNVATHKCADIPYYGSGRVDGPVQQHDCAYGNGDNQRWRLQRHGSTHGYPSYLIQNVKDGLRLDVPYYGRVTAGIPVSEYHCRTRDNQLYYSKPNSRGAYYLVNAVSGLCLDVAGNRSTSNDARLTLWPCDPDDDHLWWLHQTSLRQKHEPRRATSRTEVANPSGARVDTSGGVANVRSEPTTKHDNITHRYAGGTPVKLTCQMYGDGRWWVKLASGRGYIAAALIAGEGRLNDCAPPQHPERPDDGRGERDAGGLAARPRAETAPCSLGGSEEEVYELLFGAACVDNKDVFGPDPGPQPDDGDYPNVLQDPSCARPTCRFDARRPFYIQDIGPNGEGSYGIRWDGCSVPEQAALIPGMGDVSHPFGFNFLNACNVHDFGFRLIDRHILPESAEEAVDTFFARMLGRTCLNYPDRIAACREVALVYSTAVKTADHKPKPNDYPRVYTGPR